jgi:hypothetical protein
MICYWRRFTWTVPGLRLPRRRSTPTLHPRRPSHCLPRRLARPMAETMAPVVTGPSTTTETTRKNSNEGRGRGGSSGQTTAPTGSAGRTNAPWPTYGHPWQGHMTMYPSPVPTGQQRPQAFMAILGLYASPSLLSRP